MMTMAFKNNRSGYTLGCPRSRFCVETGMGSRSTSWTNVTRSESWDIIGMPPIRGVCDYHHDRCNALLRQASAWLPIYDQASLSWNQWSEGTPLLYSFRWLGKLFHVK